MSSEFTLLQYVIIFSDLSNKNFITGLFIDVSKAFASVGHESFIDMLNKIGVKEITNRWFKSYWSNTQQWIKVNNIKSLVTIKFEVPQSSFLRPILFLIYFNRFCEGQFNGKLMALEDNIALVYTSCTVDNNRNMLEQDLIAIRLWSSNNEMAINYNKTNITNFSINSCKKS
ncbi:uncharacterized protein LOC142322640 [Lycorma delicatula]|uniref:uncharacterized protein LOC142322640 n=1 Tax=Lycorma delicatula TaxID=130591 RepID=UPI003F513DE7